MSTQFWSHRKPTEGGHYWFHSDDDHLAFLVDVLLRPDGKWMIDTRTGERIPNDAIMAGMFKGPLHAPGPVPRLSTDATCAYCGQEHILAEEYQQVIPWVFLCGNCIDTIRADPQFGPTMLIKANPDPHDPFSAPDAVTIPIHLMSIEEAFLILRRKHYRADDTDSDDAGTHWYTHTCDQCDDDWPCEHVRAVETLAAALGQAVPLAQVEQGTKALIPSSPEDIASTLQALSEEEIGIAVQYEYLREHYAQVDARERPE